MLTLKGLKSVSFERAEFVSRETAESPHTLPLLGLTVAKWLTRSGFRWTPRDEATYVTFPLTMLHFACMRLAGSVPHSTENIERSVNSLRQVESRLDDVLPVEKRSMLTQRAVRQVEILIVSLTGIAQARRNPWKAGNVQELGEDAAATTTPMYEIQEEAKALRDRT